MKLDFRIPISPSPEFYSTVRLAALSLRSLGAPYDTARILVSVGDYADLDAVRRANAWSEDFPVEWRAVSDELFREYSYTGTGVDRFLAPSDADAVFLCDADLCLVERIDELVGRLTAAGPRRVAGLQAHYPPFKGSAAYNDAEWRRLFAEAGLPAPALGARYSGDLDDVMGRAPPYYNYGFIGFSRDAFAAIAPLSLRYGEMAWRLMNQNVFSAQVAISMLISATDAVADFLSFAYNCPNDDLPFVAPAEYRVDRPDDIRAIHYLRTSPVDRREFLVKPSAYRKFLSARKLNRVNARLRDHVLQLNRTDDLLFR